MTRKNYIAEMPWGETLIVSADLVEASASIRIIDRHGHPIDGDEEGECSTATPYQTADARHREIDAIMLAVDYCGREWFADPKDTRETNEILNEIRKQVKISN